VAVVRVERTFSQKLGLVLLGFAGLVSITTVAAACFLFITPGDLDESSGDEDVYAESDDDEGEDGERRSSRKKKKKDRRHRSPDLSGATEIDRPGDYAYVDEREGCTRTRRLTDDLKEIGLEIDKGIREGSTISEAEEERIGRDAVQEFEDAMDGRLVSTGATPRYLTEVAKPLVKQVERTGISYTFYLWEGTSMENAFALPGGHIVMSKPLYDRWLDNEAQLAMILGHEIAHVDLRHTVAVYESMRVLGVDEEDQISKMVVHLARTPYSSAQEQACDAYGGEKLHRSGYSIFQSVRLWEERDEERPARSGQGGGGLADLVLGEIENVFQSHPDASARACHLKQVAYDLYDQEPRDEAYIGETNKRTQTPLSKRVY